MRISDWSSDVCSSDLLNQPFCASGEANDQRVLQRKKRRGRRRFQHNGYIRRLVATVGQINGRGGLRSPRYPRKNDVCFRSEERRVGKEGVRTCRSRWSPYHYKRNKKKEKE